MADKFSNDLLLICITPFLFVLITALSFRLWRELFYRNPLVTLDAQCRLNICFTIYTFIHYIRTRPRMVLGMVTREEWGALPGKNQNPLKAPVKYTGWAFTISDTCSNKEDCTKLLQFLQKCHMSKGMADIKHNFLIASDGTIYEGRGWLCNTSLTNPVHEEVTCNYITVARIGMDFLEKPPTEIEIAAKEKIIQYGIENKYIIPDCIDANLLQHYG